MDNWLSFQLMELWKNTSFSFHFKVWNLHGSCLIIWFLVESRIHLSLPLSNLFLTFRILSNPCFTLIWNVFGFPVPLHLGIVLSFSPPISLSYLHFLAFSNTNSTSFTLFHYFMTIKLSILIILITIDRNTNFFTDFRHWRIAGICWQDVKPYSRLGIKETVARDDNFYKGPLNMSKWFQYRL